MCRSPDSAIDRPPGAMRAMASDMEEVEFGPCSPVANNAGTANWGRRSRCAASDRAER